MGGGKKSQPATPAPIPAPAPAPEEAAPKETLKPGEVLSSRQAFSQTTPGLTNLEEEDQNNNNTLLGS